MPNLRVLEKILDPQILLGEGSGTFRDSEILKFFVAVKFYQFSGNFFRFGLLSPLIAMLRGWDSTLNSLVILRTKVPAE